MKKIIAFLLALCFLIPNCYAAKTEKQVRGVWVGSVSNLDFPSDTGLSAGSLRAEIDAIIKNCKLNNINTVFFQVRPNSDALYNSDIFPWSEVLSGTQGVAPDGDFDPLSYIVEKAHQSGIELHAWINPYRIGDISKACADNPAMLHPEYTVTCSDGKTYYDPAIPEVRELVLSGVSEIIDNYDVDGIHFDDYFYPYDSENFPDAASFEKYGGKFKDIADFRRNNVNLLVEETSKLVHKKDKSLKFGISPFGIWANKKDNSAGSDTNGMSSYSEIYADSRYWVKQELLDYICPQIYWSIENKTASFSTLLDWWDALCKNSNTDLYIGIALYKEGTDEVGFQYPDQISRQLSLCDSKSNVDGVVFFRYGSLISEKEKSDYVPTPAVTSSSVKITGPVNGYKSDAEYCSVTGVADPSEPLSVNGNTVTMTQHGYFSAYLPLSMGINNFTFVNGDSKTTVSVRREKNKDSESDFSLLKDPFPASDSYFYSGEYVTLSLCAPSDSEVYATVAEEQIPMSAEQDGKTYSALYRLPNLLSGNDKLTLSFTVRSEGREYKTDPVNITVLSAPLTFYTKDTCYTYNDSSGGSMTDNYHYPAGTKLLVNGMTNGMYRLVSGKWVLQDSLCETETESVIDINTEKYTETTFSFESFVTFDYEVTENNELIIDFYHKGGEGPVVSSRSSTLVSCFRSATRTRATVSLRRTGVTGFYVKRNNDNTVSLWLLKKDGNGLSGKTIVLDPGHGGEDAGALGPPGNDGATEADLNLSLAQMLKEKLEKAGATVYLTRSNDTTLLLAERAELIRSYSPDLVLSLHHNSVARESDFSSASGLLTLYSRETSGPLASCLSSTLSDNTGIGNQGFRTQSLNVCRDYRFPCVLLECGYICNPAEYEKVITDSFKTSLCDNIVLTLNDYFS